MRRGEWVVPGLVVVGLLVLPFYRADLLRERFVGDNPLPDNALSGFVLVVLAVAVMSLLRRDFVRLHPAALTWGGGDRDAVVLAGVRRAWAVRFGIVGYLFVAGGAVLGWSGAPQLVAVVVAAGVFAYVAARRERHWLEYLVPFGLAGMGFVGVHWAVVAGLVLATALAWRPVARPGRRELVRGHRAHVLRATAAAFGDVLAVLPQPRPTRMRLGSALRIAVGGVLARRGMVAAALLLALVIPVLHAVFPVVAPVWWAGIGAYAATLPFAGGLADVTRVDGLRRWLPQTDTELWLAALLVLLIVAGLWLGASTLAGLPFTPAATPIAAAATVRTATRGHLDYTPSPAIDLAGAYVPVNLLRQLARGPLLLLIGLAAVS